MSNEYQVLSERIYSDFPIFGSCIRQRAAVALSKDKSPHAVKILAEAVVRSSDRKVITIALEALRNLRDRDSVNAFCQVWAESRHKDLTTILKNRRYVSTEPKFLVLSALKVGALDGIKKRGEEVLEPLLSALDDKDTQIASAASTCIAELTNRKTTDFLCRRWIENQSPRLQIIIKQGNYEPIDASIKALFYFLLGEWQKYENIDFDLSLLTKAYQTATKEVKAQISEKARTAGRVEFIKIITSAKSGFDVEKMTEKDWATFVDILEVQPDRKEIWRFLYNAPPLWSKRLLDKLAKVSIKWLRQDDEVVFNQLLSLVKNCKQEDFISSLYIEKPKHIDLTGHTDNIESVEMSPDGKLLVSHCSSLSRLDKTFHLWSLADGTEIKKIKSDDDDDKCEHCMISPDSQILVTYHYHTVQLWSLPKGNHIKTLEFPSGYYSCEGTRARASVISADSKMLACVTMELRNINYHYQIELFSLPSGNHLLSLVTSIPTGGGCKGLLFSPDGQMLVFVADISYKREWGQSVYVWRIPDGIVIKSINKEPFKNLVDTLRAKIENRYHGNDRFDSSTSNKILAFSDKYCPNDILHLRERFKDFANTGCNDNIYLWDREYDIPLRTMKHHCTDRWTFDYKQLEKVKNVYGELQDEITRLIISSDSSLLVAYGLYSHTIRLWKLPNNNISINKLTTQDIIKMELQVKDLKVVESIRNSIKFILALIRLKQQFDIDIEDSSNNIASSEFDIEIE